MGALSTETENEDNEGKEGEKEKKLSFGFMQENGELNYICVA